MDLFGQCEKLVSIIRLTFGPKNRRLVTRERTYFKN